jgi:microcystin-dependent protein
MTTYNIISPTAMVPGQPEDISVVLANFTAIAAVLNGGIDNANVNAAAAIAASKLAGYPADASKALLGDGSWGVAGGVPTGSIVPYAAAVAPASWVLCDGSSLLQSSFAALFAVIGTTYGSVDGAHFNVPDLRGRVISGFAASGGHTDVSALGNNDGVALANRRAKHRHTVNDPGHVHSFTARTQNDPNESTNAVGNPIQQTTQNTGSSTTGITIGTATDALDAPAYMVLNYIIKI